MSEILPHVMTLLMLTLLQAVLGFDNLLYISIESKRVEESRQSFVRKWGIGLAIFLRILLLIAVTQAIQHFQKPVLHMDNVAVSFDMNVHSIIVLLGGAFVIYTAVKEIIHMVADDDLSDGAKDAKRSVGNAMFWIVLMNLIFSFDSILSALAITDVFFVLATAIITSGLAMLFLADHVSDFLQRNRKYEVLGLFILLIVGVVLLGEGGHLAHLKLFGFAVVPMSKATFYFSIAVLVAVDVVQSGYQKKLAMKRAVNT